MRKKLFTANKFRLSILFLLIFFTTESYSEPNLKYVNPFIGTSNFGTTNPGAVCPNGMVSVVPFNVKGSDLNQFDKDKRWWSTPYEYKNRYFTGFSHVNLSGVGCPDLGSLLLMATTGKTEPDYTKYGSEYTQQTASPGYYSTYLTKYGIKAETTATLRSGRTRFTFPAGQGNILLNLGEGLTNETGASVKFVSDTEIEGSKLLGTFCYNSQAVFPVYFVMKIHKKPKESGYWKKMPPMGVEAQWDNTAGTYKMYTKYSKEMSGDNIGVWFSFDSQKDETVEVSLGVSYVSTAGARENLLTEQKTKTFADIRSEAEEKWKHDLSVIEVEGGTEEQKIIFYTALYHALIHPNVLNDVNGKYPAMESNLIKHTDNTRYTVFSLWDTYRNLHQLLTLLYPQRQTAMLQSMTDMYREHGWMPKWELYSRETLTMEGDPAIPVIVDSWMKGLRNFNIETAWEAMWKSANTSGAKNLLRPDNDDYLQLGYVPLREKFDNSVSHALEYYVADHALSELAAALGKTREAEILKKRSQGYTNYYCKEYGTLRPKLPDGTFYVPFDPKQGENFEPVPGFHEGSAWNYTFYVPHDVYGLAKLMGGKKKFVEKLQKVFDNNLYDPANEPNIAYPYLFSYFGGEAWRTQNEVTRLLEKYYKNAPDGLPGNDDTGTMSAWAIFSMMGFYPDCPGSPHYTLTTPAFDKITIHLDPAFYNTEKLIIEKNISEKYITRVYKGLNKLKGYRISHSELTNGGNLIFR